MKLYNKYMTILSAVALTAGLSACSDKDDYVWAEKPAGSQVYFSSSTATSYQISKSGSSVEMTILRTSTEGAVTVPINVTDETEGLDDGAFYLPNSISFVSGENKAAYVIEYNPDLLEYDVAYSFLLEIDEKSISDYGTSSIEITLQIPSPWTSLGTGTYIDAFWGVSDTSDQVSVTVQRNDLDENMYRISNPYKGYNGEDSYFQFRVLQKGETFFGQVVEYDDLVGFSEDFFVQYYDYYEDDLYLVFPARFTSLADPSNWVYNYVVAYQENGLPGEIHLSPYYYMFNVGGWNQTSAEPITIVFPGYILKDYSAEVYYKGLFTNPDNSLEVVANVSLGSDATSAKVAIVEGSDVDSAAAGIEDGSIESVVVTSSGDVNIPFDSSNPTGKYTIVVVVYDGDEAQEVESATFNYTNTGYDPNAGWESLGYVKYTDGYICAWWGVEALTYSVEIQESSETPGYYRLVNPYGEAYPYNEPGDYDANFNSYLYIDASNPSQVYIPYCESTMNWGYGDLAFSSLAGNMLEGGMSDSEIEEEGAWGSLKDGEITFPAETLIVFDEDGGSYANFLWNDDFTAPLENENGEVIAPFLVDLNSLSQTAAASVSTRSAMKPAKSSKFHSPSMKYFGLNMTKKNRNNLSSPKIETLR